jgi:5-methyltetrahydrofolate--homocysteine methyltransferase
LDKNRVKLRKRLERAEQRSQEEAQLLATLPSRFISFAGHRLPEIPRFRMRKVSVSLSDFATRIDKKTLFALNWRFGGPASREKSGHAAPELDRLFDEWIARAGDAGWVQPQGVFAICPAWSEGDDVVLFDPEIPVREIARIPFTRVIGAGKEDTVCGAQYFYPKSEGLMDAVGIQITTSGAQVDAVIERFKEEGDSEAALFLQGLSDRIAEDFAEYLHDEQRKLLSLSEGQGQRWSPGYPGMRDIHANRTIYDLLDAHEQIGVVLTDASEFSPTGTTGAVISFHPDARYN